MEMIEIDRRWDFTYKVKDCVPTNAIDYLVNIHIYCVYVITDWASLLMSSLLTIIKTYYSLNPDISKHIN